MQHPASFVRERLAGAAPATVIGASRPVDVALSGHSLVELAWDPASTGALQLQLRGDDDALVELSHVPSSNVLSVTRGGVAMEGVHPDFPSTSTVIVPGGCDRPLRLLLSLDGPLLEVFVDDGEATVSNLVVLGAGPIEATLTTERHGAISMTVADLHDPRDLHDMHDAGARASPTRAAALG